MNGDGSSAPMSRRQFSAVVHRIAWTYLEVERGLRPSHHLAKFLARDEYRRQRTVTHQPAPGEWGPVRPTDIGSVRLRGVAADRVEAVVMARRAEGKWGALIIDLELADDGWQVQTLGRLERLPRLCRHRAVEPPEPSDLLRRGWLVERELHDATAARDAVAARIDKIDDRRTKPARALRPQLDYWSEHVRALTSELTSLRRNERQVILGVAAANRGTSSDREGGDLPSGSEDACNDEARKAWERADVEIRAYRQRWDVPDDQPIIGTSPTNEVQAADRRRLIRHLLATARQERTGQGVETGLVRSAKDTTVDAGVSAVSR